MKYWTSESDPGISVLRRRLDDFYSDNDNEYQAFESTSQQHPYWNTVVEQISKLQKTLPAGAKLKVLEFGAGRSGFVHALGSLRPTVNLTLQDVTAVNQDHLRAHGDEVQICDLADLTGEFDVIFSTFVWEHVSHPRKVLETLLDHLAAGGSLFLFSPRYDVPGYVPPALRHHGRLHGIWLSICLQLSRLGTRLGMKNGDFWIVTNPSLFSVPKWFRDSDAIHLVSLYDLKAYLRGRATVTVCWPNMPRLMPHLLERLLKLCVQIRKNP